MEKHHSDDIPLTSRGKSGANVSVSYSASPPPRTPSIKSNRSHRSQTPLAPRHHFWKRPSASNVFTLFFDILFALIPIIFIVLAAMATTANNQAYKIDNTYIVYEFARVAPTLFPIIFAAVVGRLMRSYALWRAERGEKLGLIEQLHGSQNLVSALERAYLLPGLGLASVAVVLLWLTSPLGGQSSARVIRPEGQAIVVPGKTEVYYYNSSAILANTGLSGSMSSAYASYSMNGILSTSIMSLLQVKGQDLWGNVKVPFLEQAMAYSQGKLTNGWYNTTDLAEGESNNAEVKNDTLYSAMTGIITAIVVPESYSNSTILTNFTMQTTYYNMTCEKPVILNDTDAFAQWAAPLYWHTNVSEYFGDNAASYGRSFMIDTNWEPVSSESSSSYGVPLGTADTPFHFIYASRWSGLEVTAFNCSVGYTHLELNVMNDDLGSHVRGVRPTSTPEIYADYLPFWSSDVAFTYIQGLINFLESAIPNPAPNMLSPVDVYISGSDTPYAYVPDNSDPNADPSLFPTSDPDIVARRLASAINTAWQTSFMTTSVIKSPETNITLWEEATAPDYLGNGLGFSAIRTTAVTEIQILVNSCNVVWVVLTVAFACLLLVCGFLSLFLKYRTNSPDVLGFVSSMTRDNPNFEKIPGGDQMDGLGYAKKLSNVRIQLEVNTAPWNANQGGEEEEAHITLRNLGHAK